MILIFDTFNNNPKIERNLQEMEIIPSFHNLT